jgi:ATP-dependent protease ClpP protease subunit
MKTPALYDRMSPTEASLHLYGVIGDLGISAQSVADALAEAKGVKTLRVYVDSPGGDLMAGKAIYNQLARFAQTTEVVATVDGLAASAASFCIQAATRIVMTEQATMMVHEAHAVVGGKASELRKLADLLESETANLVAIYAKRAKRDPAEIAALLEAETWMTAEEAVAAGFADEVLVEEKPRAPRAVAPVVITAQQRVKDADLAMRLAAMQMAVLKIQTLRNAASRAASPGQPGSRSANGNTGDPR